MYDLHTHILPEMDDGAGNVSESLAMLEMEMAQGVEAVALTPHFYRNREHIEAFLKRRAESARSLNAALEGKSHPRLILGAEVAWVPGMADWDELESLCYQDSKVILVELPMAPWNDELFRQLNSIVMRRGITPMIAHVDRYYRYQEKKYFQLLSELEFPVQVSAAALQGLTRKRRALKLLREENAILISDCHNSKNRSPNIGIAMQYIKKKLGHNAASRIAAETESAILD